MLFDDRDIHISLSDIITVNGVHHTEYEHARVLDVQCVFCCKECIENQKDSISEVYTIATKGEMCGSVALGW